MVACPTYCRRRGFARSRMRFPWLVLVCLWKKWKWRVTSQREPDESNALCLGARCAFANPLMTPLQPRPFHSLSCGTKQVHSTFGGSSVPSAFLGGTSVPAFLRLSLTACSAPDPSKSSDTGPGYPESFSLPQGGCTCLDSWKFIIEVHWTTGQSSIGLSHPCVFFLLWNLLSGDFPGLCKWATAIGPTCTKPPWVPVVHTSLFSSKGPVR